MNNKSFYFSHDYNARADIKIKKLIVKHGYEGYGIFWALIEDLYQNANALPLDYDCIAYDLRTKSDVIESIINDFDLFKVGKDTFGSISVQRRLDKRNEKSLKAREAAMKRWNDDANALQLECDSNAIKERKVKETKVKETKIKNNTNTVFNFRKALLDYGFEEELVDEWLTIRKSKRSVNSEFAYNSFIAQVERAGVEKNELLRIIAESQWAGFQHAWLTNRDKEQNGGFINEKDRQAIESAKRKQEILDFARSVGMAGGEENQDTSHLW